MDKTEVRLYKCDNIKTISMVKYDKEYSTQYVPEVEYLKQNGIRYTFVKTIHGVSTYKYTKTSTLFKCLEFFYLSDNEKSDKNECLLQ